LTQRAIEPTGRQSTDNPRTSRSVGSQRKLVGVAVGLALALAALGALGYVAGLRAALSIGAGVLVLVATAWLPERAVRLIGPVLLAGLLFAVLRPKLGSTFAMLPAFALLVAAYRHGSHSVLRRVTFIVPSLVLLIFSTTLLMYLAPGNPFAGERAPSPQVEAALRAEYGVPEDAFEFFGIYMRRLLVEGSLGPSIKVEGRTVEMLLLPALPVSLSLGALALTLAVTFGLVLGISAGLRPNSATDYASMALALFGISLPNFVIGALLVMLFALELRILPVAGWGSLRHLIMPAITLALPYTAYVARLARSGTIEVMQQDFIRTARAKGVPEHRIVLVHALKGALLPVISFLGPAAAGILTGSFVVETLFGIPGMGQYFVRGAINRDYAVVLGTAILYSTLVTVFNLLVDVAYTWLDPRLRGQL
jgi:oligopeptide transport system permease protein